MNLIAGGAGAAGADAATATSAATAEVDNNWLSLNQIKQAGKKLVEAIKGKDVPEALNVLAEAKRTSDKQDFATTESFTKSIVGEGINDVETAAELLTKSQSDAVGEGYDNIKKTIKFFLDQPVEDIKQGVANEISGLKDKGSIVGNALEKGGDENAKQLGKILGKSAYQGATIAATGSGLIKGGAALTRAAIKKATEAAVKQSTKAAVKSAVKAEVKTAAKATENLAKTETKILKETSSSFVKGKSFTKTKSAEFKAAGFQEHHIIPKMKEFSEHDIVKNASYDIEGKANKMFMPSKDGLHETRSLHRGAPNAEAKERLLKKMDEAVTQGEAEGWTQKQYLKELKDIRTKEKAGLRSGEFKLNKAK